MASIAVMTIADGAATPVNHTFTPLGVKTGIARWQDKSTGIAIGYSTMTFSLREPSKANKTSKVQVKFVVPVTETIAPSLIPTKAFDNFFNVEFVIHERATLQDRKNLLAYAKNVLANAVLTSAVQDLDTVW